MKIAVAVIIVGAAGAGWYFWPAKVDPNLKKVETRIARVERGDITVTVTATGEIKPVKEVELKSKASGQVVQFKKEPGDPVNEGELIAELDKKVEQRNLASAEANLSSAEAQLELTRLEYQRSLKQAESELSASRADEKKKRDDLDRLEKLTGEILSKTELEDGRLALKLAEEKGKQAEASLALIRGRKEADEKLAEADVHKARVSVDDARERLKDTEILAPMKGLLLKKLVEEGQIVASGISASTGGTPIAVVADVSHLLVETNVDETDIAKVRKGQAAEISLLSGTSDRFKGRVELILPKGELDSNVMVFKVRVAMEGNAFGKSAYAGMTASVSILVAEKKGALLVPSEAVRLDGRKKIVYVPDGEGSKPVPVEVGLDNGLRAEILNGLGEDAEVYITHTSLPDQKPGSRRSMRF